MSIGITIRDWHRRCEICCAAVPAWLMWVTIIEYDAELRPKKTITTCDSKCCMSRAAQGQRQ